MRAVIPGLLDSATYELSVTVHARHHDAGHGLCAACGDPAPCAPRNTAASLIAMAGGDPGVHQSPAPPRTAPPRTAPPRTAPPGPRHASRHEPVTAPAPEPEYAGFSVTGRSRPLPETGFGYEREDHGRS